MPESARRQEIDRKLKEAFFALRKEGLNDEDSTSLSFAVCRVTSQPLMFPLPDVCK